MASLITEWICMECHTVFGSKSGECCGKQAEKFSIEKHGESLIGSSNSWTSVYEKWRNHPLFLDAVREAQENGSYGASTAMNVFIEKLVEQTARTI